MSTSIPNAQHPQPPDLNPARITTELAALAAKLRETAVGLTDICQCLSQAQDTTNDNPAEPGEPHTVAPAPYETRCYTLPDHILDEEREMLAAHKAANWQELFDKTYDQLYATVLLMGHVSPEDKIDGFSIQLIAGNLMTSLGVLSRLCSLIADFRLTNVMKVAA